MSPPALGLTNNLYDHSVFKCTGSRTLQPASVTVANVIPKNDKRLAQRKEKKRVRFLKIVFKNNTGCTIELTI